ncbi:MAG: GntR family transcriptional regulator [Cypionkella sp.]
MQPIARKKTLVEETYEILLDSICSGEFPPGTRLNQDELAARLNVSRQPINSAISILRANHFVSDTGRQGVVVSAVDADQLRSIFEFRSIVEPFAVELAGRRWPPAGMSDADEVLARGFKAVAEGNLREMIAADVAFHEMIYRWSGNAVIPDAMRLNWHRTKRFMSEVARDPAASAVAWKDHRKIISALCAGDPDTAVRIMRGHIERAYEKMLPQRN